jgi:hypothetical protein
MPSTTIVGSPMSAVLNFFPCATGSTPAVAGGFELAIDSLTLHVDGAGISRLLPAVETIMLAADSEVPSATITQQAVKNIPSSASPPSSAGMDQALQTSTLSLGSNTIQDPPPSPTTTYCVDCDAYDFVGSGYFSPHEIFGCEDPHGGTAAIYLTIYEC